MSNLFQNTTNIWKLTFITWFSRNSASCCTLASCCWAALSTSGSISDWSFTTWPTSSFISSIWTSSSWPESVKSEGRQTQWCSKAQTTTADRDIYLLVYLLLFALLTLLAAVTMDQLRKVSTESGYFSDKLEDLKKRWYLPRASSASWSVVKSVTRWRPASSRFSISLRSFSQAPFMLVLASWKFRLSDSIRVFSSLGVTCFSV